MKQTCSLPPSRRVRSGVFRAVARRFFMPKLGGLPRRREKGLRGSPTVRGIHGLMLVSGLIQGIVIEHGLHAEHVGDEPRRVVVSHTEELAELGGFHEGL